MAFLINCTNKGCYKTTEACFNSSDQNVYCLACGKSIDNVPIFTKRQMQSLGQVMKPKKSAYSVKCSKCRIDGLPKIVNNKLCCVGCGNHLSTISKPFELLIREAIKKGNEEL